MNDMIKKYRKTVNQTRTIVEDIHAGEFEYEYVIREAVHLTLVLISIHTSRALVTIRVRLKARGASANIIGIFFGSNASSMKLHTLQQHEAPQTTSNLLVKSVLADEATCIYDGGIRVEVAAQKTDAYQRNENLILSPKAHAETKPSLEILANDVRCTHGATVGPISGDQLWYLATRGIGVAHGRRLIVEGFLGSALARVDDVGVRNAVWKRVARAV
ncbi:hypothetical protein A2Z00_04860 [Candidatus Gottesmanbacteria bacterium RBG_13_45_10]|uniref:SUF system FeS cluster assembly SufBD core domain-containing protein n=1 Tax=Candidatus Gottesmanbacteria bacterium RBG_13_45_10 TaxID=1798370 RepID=A0A1F5ZGW5_9BACT|nr:MAG: hypothetical protein A2Z00_04860 [Candidatus Gottesmanbacteria bacterium RBG_13_45_10]